MCVCVCVCLLCCAAANKKECVCCFLIGCVSGFFVLFPLSLPISLSLSISLSADASVRRQRKTSQLKHRPLSLLKKERSQKRQEFPPPPPRVFFFLSLSLSKTLSCLSLSHHKGKKVALKGKLSSSQTVGTEKQNELELVGETLQQNRSGGKEQKKEAGQKGRTRLKSLPTSPLVPGGLASVGTAAASVAATALVAAAASVAAAGDCFFFGR